MTPSPTAMLLISRQDVQAGDRERDTIPALSAIAGVAWIAVLLRTYTRVFVVRRFHVEDWLMLAAIIIFSGYCGTVIATSALVSIGEHARITEHTLLQTIELVIASETFYLATLMTLKFSVGLFLLRIAAKPWQRRVILAVMVLSTAFSIAMILFVVLQCGSFVGISQFVANRVAGKCVSTDVLLGMVYAHGSMTALTDWIFIILPFFIVQTVDMTQRERVAVATLLAFASAGAIAAIVRFLYIPSLAVPITSYFTQSAPISIWSGIEPGVGIIAASVVCLRPMLRHHFGWFMPAASKPGRQRQLAKLRSEMSRHALAQVHSGPDLSNKDIDDMQLDWRSASSMACKNSEETIGWPFAIATDQAMPTRPMKHTYLPRPPRISHASHSSRQGLPLELFGHTENMRRDSWI